MITVSSNFATNLLIEKLGVENIRATVTRLGAAGMKVLRGVEDQKAFDKGLNNRLRRARLLVLFEPIGARHRRRAPRPTRRWSRSSSARSSTTASRPACRRGRRWAHKTGNITRIHHDAGIVLGPKPYVLVILVRGIQDQKESAADGRDFQGRLRESPSVTCSFVIAITIPAPDSAVTR